MQSSSSAYAAGRQPPSYGAAEMGGLPSTQAQRPDSHYDIHSGRKWQEKDDDSMDESVDTVEDPDHYEYEDCEQTAYSSAMATIVKDLHRLSVGSKHAGSRITRIMFAVMVCIFLIICQLYVLFTIKTYVTSPAVRSIRNVYNEYQATMYHGRVKDTGFGFSLGIGGPTGPFFDPAQFSKLSGDLKGSVCLIPFSQPGYLAIILFIWCLSVVGELRQCMMLAKWIRDVDRVPALREMVERRDGLDLIVGLPLSMKAACTSLVLLPRAGTALVLCFLGCRWLTATLDFTEVLINSIALTFVIQLNSLFYMQLVSDRSKRESQNLVFDMRHAHKKAPSAYAFVGTFIWAVGAIVWVYAYINHFQMVIPGYQWDVAVPCKPWVTERFNFWRI